MTTLKIEFGAIKLDPAKFNQDIMPFSIFLQELSFFGSTFVNVAATYPVLEDLLWLCGSLKKLKLSKPLNAGATIEELYPFVVTLPKYDKIVELA